MNEDSTITINIGSGSTDDVIVIPASSTMGDVFVNGHGDTFTIDLNNRAGATTSVWADAGVTINPWGDETKDTELTFDLDPLVWVLIMASKGYDAGRMFEAFEESKLPSLPDNVAEFINQANEIREHFRVKLITDALKGKAQTDFRKALGTIVANESFSYKKSLIKIFVRLPDFYKEDLEVESLIENVRNLKELRARGPVSTGTFIGPLTYITKYVRKRRGSKTIRYAFKDDSNYLYMLSVMWDNPLSGILEYVCSKQKRLTVSAIRSYNTIIGYDFDFFELKSVEIKDE